MPGPAAEGEHGDSEVPAWSLANISGMHLEQFCRAHDCTFDAAAKEGHRRSGAGLK